MLTIELVIADNKKKEASGGFRNKISSGRKNCSYVETDDMNYWSSEIDIVV